MTSRMQIKLGTEFSITLPNGREKDFEVENLHQLDADGNPIVFDSLKCEILNSTSWSPPVVYVIDDVNHVVKIKFTDSTIPMTTPLTLLVQGCVSTVVVEKVTNVMFNGETVKKSISAGLSDFWIYVRKSFYLFGGASIFLYFISGSTFGDWVLNAWSNLNAAKMIQMSNQMDSRILTNKHDVYRTAAFIKFNGTYKWTYGDDHDLSDLYNFVGNRTFLTKYLIQNDDGSIMLADHGDAVNYCRSIGGRLLKIEELKAYLAGKYISLENMAWPVRLHEQTPEWTADDVAGTWDNYWVYIKDEKGLIYNHASISFEGNKTHELSNGYTLLESDDGIEFAFRCALDEDSYIKAK